MTMASVFAICNAFFPDRIVRNGPFKGMKYLDFDQYHCNLFPKLLGSYEHELSETINEILTKEFRTVINIGCAEGYYSVGFARRFKSAMIHAYDIDPDAQKLCLDMAKINSVEGRVIIYDHFGINQIKAMPDNETLLICDCEGYEKELFSSHTAPYFKNCHLLIETHDCFELGISRQIKDALCNSHHIQSIYSIEDSKKPESYNFEEVDFLPMRWKQMLLAERRIGPMEWLFLTPKLS